MGRRIIAGRAALISMKCAAAGLPQSYLDEIREHETQRILGTSEQITTLQSDVAMLRRAFAVRSNVVDVQSLPGLDPIPLAQLFKHQDLTLGQIVKLTSAASGYEATIHPDVNQNVVVKINGHPNALDTIAEYLTRVTDTNVIIWPESRAVTVMPKQVTR